MDTNGIMIEFKLNKLSDYSDESILEEIRRVSKVVNEKPLSVVSFDKESCVNHTTVARRFGSWIKALKKAGLDEYFIHTKNKRQTKEGTILELQRVANILGKNSFTAHEFEQHSEMSRSAPVFYREFGTFKKALEAAGLTPPVISKRYTDEERYENLLNVWTYYGRQPNYAEMKNPPSVVGPKAYITKWGSWRKALQAFVEKVNQDLEEQEYEEAPKKDDRLKKIHTSKPEEDRREIKLGLRYKILSRDLFKCKKCGDSPATNHKCKLHVDHILPFSKGGKTISDNLQTLCDKCNLGKGNRFTE